MKYLSLLILIFILFNKNLLAQENQRKNYFPLWTFHQKNINIHGLSLGFWSTDDLARNTNTNGVKLELIGLGILLPLNPESPIVESDSELLSKEQLLSEKINGLNLSLTGSVCNCATNGISLGIFCQIQYKVNGISATLLMNFIQEQNGIMISMLNDSYKQKGIQLGLTNRSVLGKGLQIGFINRSENFKGIQLGIWNVNNIRRLPFINWNFRKTD